MLRKRCTNTGSYVQYDSFLGLNSWYSLTVMTMEAAEKICAVMGDVIRPSEPKEFDGGAFLRMKVLIDLSLLLCCGRLIFLNNDKQTWITFKYERLPNLCYWCGCLTHADRDYDFWINSEGTLQPEQKQFGPHLRAPVFVQLKEINEELRQFKKMDSTFHFFFNSKPHAPISNLNESRVEQEDTRASSISTQLRSLRTWTHRARLELSNSSTQLEQNARYK